MEILVFVIIFSLITNRYWIRSFIEGFTKGKSNSRDIKDQRILDLIKNKTGLKLSKIKLLDTTKSWAMMAGLPKMPYMVISKDAYENLNKDEFQWLLLHEAGHYVLWHNVKMILLHFIFILIGSLILLKLNPFINTFILAVFLSVLAVIVYTQISRRFEYEANYYALSKMDNPKGIKNLYEKAKSRWWSKGYKGYGLKHKLFNVWILDIYKDLMLKAR